MRLIVLSFLIVCLNSCSGNDLDDTLDPPIPNIPYTLIYYTGQESETFGIGQIVWQFDLLENSVTIENNSDANLKGLLFSGVYPLFLNNELLFVNGEFGYSFAFEDTVLTLTSILDPESPESAYELRFNPL